MLTVKAIERNIASEEYKVGYVQIFLYAPQSLYFNVQMLDKYIRNPNSLNAKDPLRSNENQLINICKTLNYNNLIFSENARTKRKEYDPLCLSD